MDSNAFETTSLKVSALKCQPETMMCERNAKLTCKSNMSTGTEMISGHYLPPFGKLSVIKFELAAERQKAAHRWKARQKKTVRPQTRRNNSIETPLWIFISLKFKLWTIPRLLRLFKFHLDRMPLLLGFKRNGTGIFGFCFSTSSSLYALESMDMIHKLWFKTCKKAN